jgi:hypothetical protein
MKSEKQYTHIRNELDRIVRFELERRAEKTPETKEISPLRMEKINESIEIRNREIVEAHQQHKTASILPSLLSAYLRIQEGGDLHIPLHHPEEKKQYRSKKERLETLFAAALMALDDKKLIETVQQARKTYDDYAVRIKEILLLIQTAESIRKEADMTRSLKPADEKSALAYLRQIAPLRSDLNTVRSRYREIQDNEYLREAARKLGGALHSADRSIAEKSKNAAKYLFDQAGSVFHSFKSTPATIPNAEIFNQQKEVLARYAALFEEIGDSDRQEKILRYISAVDTSIDKLQNEVEKQKESESKQREKEQKEITDCYDRFLDIKAMFARGEMGSDSQRKNAGEKLKKYRDTLIANGQRLMALDIERFINSTGIGKKESRKTDDFDYRKAFHILLPVSIILLLLVLIMIVL